MIVRERKIDDAIIFNQNNYSVTIFREHIMIAGETFLISERLGSNKDESVAHFIKAITIAGNHKSISAKRNNTFAKRNNQNDLSGNRFSSLENIFFVPKNRSGGNILQESGRKLKEDKIILSSAGNVLQEDDICLIFSGNKFQEDESNLKNLGS